MKKIALVTGASGGIGKSIILDLAQNNYDVIINYHTKEKEALSLLEKVKNMGADAICIKCDITNEEEVKKMFEEVKQHFGHLDHLVNNAAIANDGIFLDKTSDDFIKVYKTNLVGTFLCSKYAAKIMSKDGSIVNISSTNGIDTFYPYSADYDCSKAALISLSNNLAVELAPIRVNTVAPGWVITDMNKNLSEEYIKQESEKILLNRFAQPSEIAKIVTFLCSDSASYINQSIIRVDGGSY